MEAYNYHYITKEYTGSEEAYLDPAYKRPLLAANQTFIKPEQPKEGHVMVFKDKGWVEVIDHRGLVFNKDTKQLEQWSNIDQLPPSLTKLVPKEHDKWDEEKDKWIGHEDYIKKQLEHEASYEFKRRRNYPPLFEQLDTLYWDMKKGTDNWVKSREAVKEKYPKPENENEKV